MAEKDQAGRILVAHGHESIDDLRRRTNTETAASTPTSAGFGELAAEIRNFTETQGQINQAMRDRHISFEQFMALSQKQIADLLETMGRMDPEEERRRWVDVEYSQDFYTRFQPNQEPRFYTHLSTKERQEYDARWQLARAAFVKKATAAFPDKYRENQDLALMGKEQMESLFNMPGVREMLKYYTTCIRDKKEVVIPGKKGKGKAITFWHITDAQEFEMFRKVLRDKLFAGEIPEKWETQLKKYDEPDDREKALAVFKKEADAVAWNLLWVGNLVESADSRYSYSGSQHKLPSVICAGEYRAALHQQEKFEDKCVSGHFWSAFGKWGATQLGRISAEVGVPKKDIEFRFQPAPTRDGYWHYSRLTGEEGKPKEEEKTCVVLVDAPECCPVTAGVSFWEQNKLLDALVKQEPIDWEKLNQDAWSIYMMGKFHKATALMEFFEPGKPLDTRKPGTVYEWSNEILELFVRLGIDNDYYDKLQHPKNGAHPTFQSFKSIKAWALYAALGGVKEPTQTTPTLNYSFRDSIPLMMALADKRVKYFSSPGDYRL